MRYEAEEAARVRSQDAEADARRRVQEARRTSQELVLDRLHGLSRLSEEIQGQYRQIVEGIDAAQAIGDELRLLVEKLDRAAQQLRWEGSVGLAADASVDRVQ